MPSTQPITSKVTVPLPGSQTLASLRVAQFSPSPSALFRVRPTSMLIFRLVVSANYLQPYITCPHNILPSPNSSYSPSPRANTTATQSPSHPPTRVFPLHVGVTPLYPHQPCAHGRSTRARPTLFPSSTSSPVIVALSIVAQSTQSSELGYRPPVAHPRHSPS